MGLCLSQNACDPLLPRDCPDLAMRTRKTDTLDGYSSRHEVNPQAEVPPVALGLDTSKGCLIDEQAQAEKPLSMVRSRWEVKWGLRERDTEAEPPGASVVDTDRGPEIEDCSPEPRSVLSKGRIRWWGGTPGTSGGASVGVGSLVDRRWGVSVSDASARSSLVVR